MATVDLAADRWIILGSVPHGDGAMIVRAFSETLGSVGVWVPTGKRKPRFLHPLALVEAHGVGRRGAEGLLRYKELTRAVPMEAVVTEARRSAVAFFLAEVMWRTFPEEHAQADIFEFLWQTAENLSVTAEPHRVHLDFLIGAVQILGLSPDHFPSQAGCGFNLATGEWEETPMENDDHWGPVTAAAFVHCLRARDGQEPAQPIAGAVRRKLVAGLVRYIQHHLSGPRTIKSLEVLEALFA